MNTLFNKKRIWALIQIVAVLTLLSGCGSSNSSEEDDTTSSDTSLSGLTLTGATLEQLFQTSQTAYNASAG
jgi:hypothetical protein